MSHLSSILSELKSVNSHFKYSPCSATLECLNLNIIINVHMHAGPPWTSWTTGTHRDHRNERIDGKENVDIIHMLKS